MRQKIAELRIRLQRPRGRDNNLNNTHCLQHKIVRQLRSLRLSYLIPNSPVCDDDLLAIQKEIQKILVKQKTSDKHKRINIWSNLMRNGTKSKNRCVYKWIQSKTNHQLPNFVLNAEGKILFDPKEAILEVHSVWDTVFSVNAGFRESTEILPEIWPLVEQVRKATQLPKLRGADLRSQVLKRNVRAAAGLDGWRTVEAQLLPVQFYNALAAFFIQIENGERSAPHRITQVKQVLLPKPGSKPGDPLSKRIIALLSVFIVSYTSLRLKQLCHWQSMVFPPQLVGGIKGRHLATIPMQLRLDIDNANKSGRTLIGIKLDKSKAFDRIVPAVASLLMLAFGIEHSVVIFFYTALF